MMDAVRKKTLPRGIVLAVVAASAVTVGLLSAHTNLRTVWQKIASPAATPFAIFGRFHAVWFACCVALAALCGAVAFRLSEKRRKAALDSVVFLCGTAFLLLEVFKQFLWCFAVSEGGYPFAIFPFQFCSLPLYLCPAAPFLPTRAKTACYRFLALYGTVGGALVVGYPDLSAITALAVHSMLWHTVMIALGVFLLISCGIGADFRAEWGSATAVFLLSFAAATLLNLVLRKTGVNLFYMSPYHTTYFWVIGDVQTRAGWGAAALLYLHLFAFAAAFPMWFSGKMLLLLRRKQTKKKKER